MDPLEKEFGLKLSDKQNNQSDIALTVQASGMISYFYFFAMRNDFHIRSFLI